LRHTPETIHDVAHVSESGKGIPDFSTTIRRRSLPVAATRRRALRIVHSPDRSAEGRTLVLDGDTYAFGRSVSGPGRVADNHVSREHARFVGNDAGYVIEDAGGANGTFVDGARLRDPIEVVANQVISLGDTLIVVDEELDFDLLPATEDADGSIAREVVGISYAAERIRRSLATVAPASGAVLLLGETGTGKEICARAIHRISERPGNWVPVNCAAIPADIAEAEFFGHSKGAFTGAVVNRDGYFLTADRGTIFLDEVGDLAAPLQAKLLRVLEDSMVAAIGGGTPRQVDLRVVAGTNLNLEVSGFRLDLLSRLGDWTLHLPTLAQRRSDILPLWDYFLALESGGGQPRTWTAELGEALLLHAWPMNIRELRKLAKRTSTLGPKGSPIDLPLLPEQMRKPIEDRRMGDTGVRAAPARRTPSVGEKPAAPPPPKDQPLGEDANAPDTNTLEQDLRAAKGNVSLLAQQYGCHRTQVYRWLRRAGLDPDRFR
jgi:sigma-54 dependent transcriptional regulator, acetoin dehydrogenase operon transcriptional activator AcoR